MTLYQARTWRWIAFGAWLAAVTVLAAHHAFWRDEVRALSIALQGENAFAMLRLLHGEGHPALWYLLLRGAHALVPRPEVLPATALLVAIAGSFLLVRYSPFHPLVIALILGGGVMTFEYAVMARNYGISMLLLFAIAACYERSRARGIVLGVLLLLLANTNVHSLVLVLTFLLFWFVDVIREHGLRWSAPLRNFAWNAGLAALGAVLCIATVYPPYNDAATMHATFGAGAVLRTVFEPALTFASLVQISPDDTGHGFLRVSGPEGRYVVWLLSLIVAGSALVLVRSAGAFVAALVALTSLSLLFTFVYAGSYRHDALYLIFLVALWWIVLERGVSRTASPLASRLVALGGVLIVLLLVLQVPTTVMALARLAPGSPPESRSRDLGTLLGSRPELRDAIVIADPDYLIEPLPYYVSNRTYLMREERFGAFARFTKNARLLLDLNDVLRTARTLQRTEGRPVAIVLSQPLYPSAPPADHLEGYDWVLRTTPAGVRAFVAATRLVDHLRPAVTDESYDVYTLR